jgi:hypothetical protein
MSDREVVELTFVGIRPQRPPKQLLFFDARLLNPAEETRWYLVSDDVTVADQSSSLDVDVAYVYELSGQGRVMVVTFAGNCGFLALCLPAGAHIELRNLPLRLWGNLPDDVTVNVTIAVDLEIGGQQIESWLDMSLQSDSAAVVDAQALSTRREVIRYKNIDSQDRKPVALGPVESILVTLPISI